MADQQNMWADQTRDFNALTDLLLILCFTLENKVHWNPFQSALLAGRWWKVLEVKKDKKQRRAQGLAMLSGKPRGVAVPEGPCW